MGEAGDVPRRLLSTDVKEEADRLINTLEVVWLFHGIILIFLMQVGFAMLESGAVRAKNRKTVLLKNMVDVPITAVAWWLLGHWLATGVWQVDFENPRASLNVLFGYGFANCATTIVSGGVTERITLIAYGVLVFVTGAFTYPLVAFAVWHPDGILHRWGFVDFSGSAVVHVLGGTVAGVAAQALGPRRYAVPERIGSQQAWGLQHDRARSAVRELGLHFTGKFDFQAYVRYLQTLEDRIASIEGGVYGMVAGGRVHFRKFERPDLEGQEFRPNSPTHVVLGTMLIWAGWYGFNACSTPIIGGDSLGRICCNTIMAACGGLASAAASIRLQLCPRFSLASRSTVPLLSLVCNNALAGLATACAAANTMSPAVAFAVGFAGALCHRRLSWAMVYWCIDDPLDAAAVHVGGGLVGAILGPMLCFDGPYGGNCKAETHLHIQVAGAFLIACFAAAVTAVLCEMLRRLDQLRWPVELEDEGMDATLKESDVVVPTADLMSVLPSMVPKPSNLTREDLNMLLSKNEQKMQEGANNTRKTAAAPRIVCQTRVHAGTKQDLDYINDCHVDLVKALGCKAVEIQRTTKLERALSLYLPMDGLLVSGIVTPSDTLKASIASWRGGDSSDQAAVVKLLQTTTTRSSYEEIELAVLKYALTQGCPVLAVNRGCCLVNLLLGGSVARHRHGKFEAHCLDKLHPDYGSFKHAVNVVPGSPMDEWYSEDLVGDELCVNSYHEQCIDQLADCLVPMARAPDGSVEAYYKAEYDPEKGKFLVGMQFNSDRMLLDVAGTMEIYRTFLRACQVVKESRAKTLREDLKLPKLPKPPDSGVSLRSLSIDSDAGASCHKHGSGGPKEHTTRSFGPLASDQDASSATPVPPSVMVPSSLDTVVGKKFQAKFEALPPGMSSNSSSTGSQDPGSPSISRPVCSQPDVADLEAQAQSSVTVVV